MNSFLGAKNWVSWVGAKKFMLKKFICFFRSPKVHNQKGPCRGNGGPVRGTDRPVTRAQPPF